MSGQLRRSILCTVALIVASWMLPGPAFAYHMVTYYPVTGDLLYDGQLFADSYFRWDTPGTWQTAYPGYEHDLILESDFISACTSYTDMPYGYDDCPTAGKDENPDQYAFAFGSYHGHALSAYQYYMGGWRLAGGSTMEGLMRLRGQETKHGWWCGMAFDYHWCRNNHRTLDPPMVAGTFRMATGEQYWTWNLSD